MPVPVASSGSAASAVPNRNRSEALGSLSLVLVIRGARTLAFLSLCLNVGRVSVTL